MRGSHKSYWTFSICKAGVLAGLAIFVGSCSKDEPSDQLECVGAGCNSNPTGSGAAQGASMSVGGQPGASGDNPGGLPTGGTIGATGASGGAPVDGSLATGGASAGGASATGGTVSSVGSGGGSAGSGGGSNDTGTGGGAAEPEATCPSDDIFADGELHSVRLTIGQEQLNELENNGHLEEYVAGDVEFDGEAMGQVGVRYKGSDSSLGLCWVDGVRNYDEECAKISLKIKFNKYVEDTRLCGMKRINLHSMRGDPTKLHERLSYGLFRSMGVKTCRSAHARVFVNDEFRGIFALIEQIDGRFTANRWPEAADGNLYKELWPGLDPMPADIAPDDWRPWDERVVAKLKTNEDIADVGEMTSLHQTVLSSSAGSFLNDLSPIFDIDNLVRYIAVDRAISNIDGIMRFYAETATTPQYTAGNHNFYLYQLEAGGKFVLVPWDLDKTFEIPDVFLDAGLPNWNVLPSDCTQNTEIWGYAKPPACDRFIGYAVQNIWDEFALVGQEFLNGPFNVQTIQADIDRWKNQISSSVQEDPNLVYDDWDYKVNELRDSIPALVSAYQNHLSASVINQ